MIYDAFREWEPRALDAIEGIKRGTARIFYAECGRQVGKTHCAHVIRGEDCFRLPGGRFRSSTALAKDITEIVIPNMETILELCPRALRPEYRGSKMGEGAGYYFKNGAVLRLVGIDKNPNGLRGRTCDGDTLSEVGFVGDLRRIVSSVLYPQYLRRKRARMFMESSAPEDPDHDVDTYFIPDAKRRKAFVEMTIDDNDALDDETKAEFLDAAYEIDPVAADREYRNKRTRDGSRVVVPEFDKIKHVRELTRPDHARAITAADPGFRHLFGLVYGYFDFDEQRAVIEASDALQNTSTLRVACTVAAREFDLWGRMPDYKMRDIPLESIGDRLGWVDLLKNHELFDLCDQLYAMAQIPPTQRSDFERRPGQFVLDDIPGAFTFHDGKRFFANPQERVTDVDPRMVHDVSELYGLEFRSTDKDHLRTVMVAAVRNWSAKGRLVFLPGAGPVLEHVSSGKWAKDRTHFDEHKIYGHYDCLAALVYFVRACTLIENERPHPPQRAQFAHGQEFVARSPWAPKEEWEIELDRVQESVLNKGQRGRMRGT